MTDAFSAAAAVEGRAWTLLADGQPSRLVGDAVTPDFFRVFGEYPAMGRFFTPEDNHFFVILSDALWRSQYGADPAAVGRSMMLDNKSYRIVGVAPAGFRFPAQAQLWVPLILEPERLLDSGRGRNVTLSLFARRKDGVSEAQAIDRVKRHVDSLKSEDAVRGGEISAPRWLCCSPAAPTSRDCCSRAPPAGVMRSPFAFPSAQRRGRSSASFCSKAFSSALSAGWPDSPWPPSPSPF
jgi:hypothetical protein